MNKNPKIEQFRDFFRLQRLAATRPNILENIERLATGALLWCFRLRLEDRKLGKVLDRDGELSFDTKRQHDQYRRTALACRYGRVVDKDLETTIGQERFAMLGDRGIRLLIANHILRKGGEYRISTPKEVAIQVLGWIFVALCLAGFVLIAALIWVSPAGVTLKVILTAVCASLLFPIGYAMGCYTIRPYYLIKRMSS